MSLLSPHHRLPVPSPSSSSSPVTIWFPYTRERPWLTFTTEVNLLWWLALALSFLTRFWRIDFPHYVVSVYNKPLFLGGKIAIQVELKLHPVKNFGPIK